MPSRSPTTVALAVVVTAVLLVAALGLAPGTPAVGSSQMPSRPAARPSAPITLASARAHPNTGTPLGTDPPELDRLSMADDVADGYLVAFGGANPALSVTGYTLAYRNGTWTNLTGVLPGSPPPRWGESMLYDPVDHEVVLFGGCQILSCDPGLADTWTFSGGQWHDITSTAGTPPTGRGFSMFAWDYLTGYGVLFGGRAGTTTSTVYYSDTWEFLGNHWTNLTAALNTTQPSARDAGAMASLPAGPAILFGGATSGGVVADTWSFGSGNWTNLTSTAGSAPSARALGMIAPDPIDGYLVFFGGSSGGSYLGGTWTFAAGTWSSGPSVGPPPTYAAAGAFDSEDRYVLMYGGAISQNGQTGVTNGYWSYSAGSWHLFNPEPAAPINWLFLLPVGFLALFGLEFALISWRQNRRLDEVSALMPEPPPGVVQWIPTQPRSAIGRNTWISASVVYAIVLPASAFITLTATSTLPAGGDVNLLLFLGGLWAFMLLLPAVMLTVRRASVTRQIGIAPEGVLVQRIRRTVRIPWEYIQPPTSAPRGPWLYFRHALPGRQGQPGAFGATREQTLAILSHPRAAGWVIPPPVRERLSLTTPFTRASAPVPGPIAGVNWPPAVTPVQPLPTAPAPAAEAPLPASPVDPLRSGPAESPTSSRIRPPPLRRCPNCSALWPLGARFCSRCGQKMF